MFSLFNTQPEVEVSPAEYLRLLGYPPGKTLAGRALELTEWARDWYRINGRPWILAQESGALHFADNQLVIGTESFASKRLYDLLHDSNSLRAILLAVSAGPECENQARQLWQDAKPDEYFFLEVYGSAVVEQLVTIANRQICSWAAQNSLFALSHYGPGYSGWNVRDQFRLGRLLLQDRANHPSGELEVMDTGMLRPKKSVLALVGLSADLNKATRFTHHSPCENCYLAKCEYRRAAYKNARPQIEQVDKAQGEPQQDSRPTTHSRLPIITKYSFNERALQKWSQERLRLEIGSDGTVLATFRYEGTTCTNLGQPLEFDYRIKLTSAKTQHRILEVSCAPAQNDAGHAHQCEYLKDPAALMGRIGVEQPLVGQPLSDVLRWKRPANPGGCYCDLERRNHKWGLVYETIHYALVNSLPADPRNKFRA